MNYSAYAKLPDPFVFDDGSRVRSRDDWDRRRREILETVITTEYGGMPPVPEVVDAELLHTHKPRQFEGVGHQRYRIRTGPAGEVQFVMDVLVPDESGGPHPVVIHGDGCWMYDTDEVIREVLGRGFMLVRFDRCELAPDAYHTRRTAPLYRAYPDIPFGALSAWAWGYHRCIDVLLKRDDVDSDKIAVTGHSRGGKTVLLAAATDQRIALSNPNNSGCGGAGCMRIRGQGSEALEDILGPVAYWFGPQMKQYIGREDEVPFDQHHLKALVAPRGLVSTEALEDLWANPVGSWHTYRGAKEVYRLLGAEDHIGITFRQGGHDHGLDDWRVFLDFAERLFSGKPVNRSYDQDPFDEPPGFDWSAPAPG